MVGGMTPRCTARIANAASTPPAAPSMWPVIDFVELTITRLACSPNTALTASVSAMSPCGVEGADAERRPRRLGAAGEHRVRVAALDEPHRLADRVRAGRARRDVRHVRALEAEADRREPRRHVDDDRGHEVRRDAAPRALL